MPATRRFSPARPRALPLLPAGLLLALAPGPGPAACQRSPGPGLPAATQVGRNTAGCLIDGRPFVAASYGGGVLSAAIPALQGGFSFRDSYRLAMHGLLAGQGVEVMLFLQGRQPGPYLLNQDTPYYPQATPTYVLNHATYRVASSPDVYATDARHTGRVVLTAADVPRGLSAGTFEFTAVSTRDSTRTVTLTSGRFDRGDW